MSRLTNPTLVAARDAKRLSQERLAAMAGVSTKTVIRLEQGANPGNDSALKIAAALDMDVDELFPREQAA